MKILKLNQISNLPDILDESKKQIYLTGDLKEFLTKVIVEPANTVQMVHDTIDDVIDDTIQTYCFTNYSYLGNFSHCFDSETAAEAINRL